jgi:hypothetical protein
MVKTEALYPDLSIGTNIRFTAATTIACGSTLSSICNNKRKGNSKKEERNYLLLPCPIIPIVGLPIIPLLISKPL